MKLKMSPHDMHMITLLTANADKRYSPIFEEVYKVLKPESRLVCKGLLKGLKSTWYKKLSSPKVTNKELKSDINWAIETFLPLVKCRFPYLNK